MTIPVLLAQLEGVRIIQERLPHHRSDFERTKRHIINQLTQLGHKIQIQ